VNGEVGKDHVQNGEIEREYDDDKLWESRKLRISSLTIWMVESDAAQSRVDSDGTVSD
jgi:hypothetical protein